jgi:hypothetical protein
MSGLEASKVVLQEAQAGTLGVTQDVPTPGVPTGDNVPIDNMSGKPDVCECGKPNETGRSTCAACRKRAYRERSRG